MKKLFLLLSCLLALLGFSPAASAQTIPPGHLVDLITYNGGGTPPKYPGVKEQIQGLPSQYQYTNFVGSIAQLVMPNLTGRIGTVGTTAENGQVPWNPQLAFVFGPWTTKPPKTTLYADLYCTDAIASWGYDYPSKNGNSTTTFASSVYSQSISTAAILPPLPNGGLSGTSEKGIHNSGAGSAFYYNFAVWYLPSVSGTPFLSTDGKWYVYLTVPDAQQPKFSVEVENAILGDGLVGNATAQACIQYDSNTLHWSAN